MRDLPKPFTPASPLVRAWHGLLYGLNRYLTPISIGVALIGLLLVGIGPARDLLAERLGAARSGEGGAPGERLTGGSVASASLAPGLVVFDREPAPYTVIPDRPLNRVTTYQVQPGDTLFGIAERFGIEPNTVFWANSETLRDNVHMLQPGMDLYILPVNGVYHKSDGEQSLQRIADKYLVDVDAIIGSEYNELDGYTAADAPPWGMRIVIPDGYREVEFPPVIVETVDEATGVVSRSFMPGMGGSCAAGIAGSGGTGVWALPLAAFAFTQAFYPGHSGVDLAAPVGTPVLAADDGVVIFAGWTNADWGYGILVVLDHGNGWTTYYAHLSSVGVGCGQYVSRGGYVGAVGSTGQSSGPHLHFEMRWNHVPDNPASYIGF